MKLAVINGSPRGRDSNSSRIAGWITSSLEGSVEVCHAYVFNIARYDELMAKIGGCDYYLFIFPLYTDSMPGLSKAFMEKMEEHKPLFSGKNIAFIIHSGFPESSQSLTVERYTRYFASLLGMNCTGTIKMGGSEIIRSAPDSFFKDKVAAFQKIAKNIERSEPFDAKALEIIGSRKRHGAFFNFIFKHIDIGGIYWNRILRKNKAYKSRFDRPYLND
ncbi:MAG: NAD(P)H-dependent oxidoreductase [Clostridia bacterium]|nr:NAD(P)H-dependent oxidoreductase [Clostridia bacterium]